MTVLIALAILFAWSLIGSSNGLETNRVTTSQEVSGFDLSSQSSNQNDFSMADLFKEISKIRTDLDSMQDAIGEIQQEFNALSESTAVTGTENNSANFKELYDLYMQDPNHVTALLAPYIQERNVGLANQIDAFFTELPDSDPAWSEKSQLAIQESISSNSSLQNIALTQVNEATCKSNVCKVDISLSSNNPEGFSQGELFEAENMMLITLAKDFPNARLKMIELDGQISFQGYVNDRSVTLPRNEIDINDPATLEQIRSILTQ